LHDDRLRYRSRRCPRSGFREAARGSGAPRTLGAAPSAATGFGGAGGRSLGIITAAADTEALASSVADNGGAWYVSGAPDMRWDDDELHEIGGVTGRDFEAVDTGPVLH